MTRRRAIEAVLSLFVLYHLHAVVLTPMLHPPFGESLGAWARPYVTTFGFTNAWEFFAPNPAPPLVIEWQAEDSRGTVVGGGLWPSDSTRGLLHDRETRSLSALFFFSLSDASIEAMMLPYLCARDSRFRSVRLGKEARSLPPLLEVRAGRRRVGDGIGTDRKFVMHGFCGGRSG